MRLRKESRWSITGLECGYESHRVKRMKTHVDSAMASRSGIFLSWPARRPEFATVSMTKLAPRSGRGILDVTDNSL